MKNKSNENSVLAILESEKKNKVIRLSEKWFNILSNDQKVLVRKLILGTASGLFLSYHKVKAFNMLVSYVHDGVIIDNLRRVIEISREGFNYSAENMINILRDEFPEIEYNYSDSKLMVEVWRDLQELTKYKIYII
jgi:hypothetical protein